MKKSISTGEGAVQAPRRFNGWGILAASVALATLVFLVVGPMVERNAHLEALDDLEDQERLKRGLLMLCNTQANIVHLNDQLEQKSLEERNRVTRVARTLDCIKRLKPNLQAEYYLWNGVKGDVAYVVAQGGAAIEPSIEALESDDPLTRGRAARALVTLSEGLNGDHSQRIARRLLDDDLSDATRALRLELGLPSPVVIIQAPEQDEPPRVEIDMADELVVPDAGQEMADMSDELDAAADELDAGPDEDVSPSSDELAFPGEFQLKPPTLELRRPRVLYQRAP